MKLYHGTPASNLNSILSNGLKLNQKSEFSEDSKTEQGYIYLTDNIAVAAYYGNMQAILNEEPCLEYIIFEIEIEENELLIDYDEIKYTLEDCGISQNISNVEECLDLIHCCRISKPIKKEITQYTRKPPENIHNEYISSLQNRNKENKFKANELSKKLNWIKVYPSSYA